METRVLSLEDKFTFGKYKGKSIHSILHEDPSYIVWANDNIEWFKVLDGIYDEACSGAAEQRRQYYIDNLDPIDYYDYCGGDDY